MPRKKRFRLRLNYAEVYESKLSFMRF